MCVFEDYEKVKKYLAEAKTELSYLAAMGFGPGDHTYDQKNSEVKHLCYIKKKTGSAADKRRKKINRIMSEAS